jgi:hypothetical protein
VVVLGLTWELKHSTTWAMLPTLFACYVLGRVSHFLLELASHLDPPTYSPSCVAGITAVNHCTWPHI